MAKLTKRIVESIKPGARGIIIWDSELPGFGVRVSPKGKRTYILKYRVGRGRGGRVRKPSLGIHGVLTVDQARVKARRWLVEVGDGGDPRGDIEDDLAAPTVAELAAKYLADHARPHNKPRSAHENERMIANHVVPLLGKMKVADVTRADIERALAAVKAGRTAKDVKTGKHGRSIVRGGPFVANRVRAVLSTMFNLAEEWEFRPGQTNPCRHAHKNPEPRRERFLSPDELGRLGAALADSEADGSVAPAAIAAIRLLLLTGCRLMEILSLRWDAVDIERACLRLADSKSGQKIVLLAPPALAVLAACPRIEGNPYVLPGIIEGHHLSSLKVPWSRVRDRAGLAGVRVHDLRHCFASIGAAAGVPLLTIGKLLGHADTSMTARYAHLARDPARQAVETIAATIDASLSGKLGGEVVSLPSRRRDGAA